MSRKWTLAGGILWIAGLIVFITGLNLNGSIRDWMTAAGTAAFLAGLGITGAVWLKKQSKEK